VIKLVKTYVHEILLIQDIGIRLFRKPVGFCPVLRVLMVACNKPVRMQIIVYDSLERGGRQGVVLIEIKKMVHIIIRYNGNSFLSEPLRRHRRFRYEGLLTVIKKRREYKHIVGPNHVVQATRPGLFITNNPTTNNYTWHYVTTIHFPQMLTYSISNYCSLISGSRTLFGYCDF